MPPKELWTWIHSYYGEDLALTSSDEDYVAPQTFDELSDKLRDDIPAVKIEVGVEFF